jgi:8-oxo-dGTP diphosphatase
MTVNQSPAESVSSFVGEEDQSQMYMAVKGRRRRPSAKLLDVLQTGSELSLQCAVAEVVMNADDADLVINPRSSPVLIEKIATSVWRTRRQSLTPKRKISEEVKEELPAAPSVVSEDKHDVDLDQSLGGDAGAESKRKRGRPFKGQEKPIEERLLMETSKIRRLIEDVLRKNPASLMCSKLRQIVADIDSVIMEHEQLRMRPAARALILSDDGYVLLVKFEFGQRGVFWAMPGGGKEEHETFVEALERELKEEVGLEEFVLGPHIWNREQLIPNFGEWDGQREQIFLVQVPQRFDPNPAMTWEQLNSENIFEIRWWSLEELMAAKDDSTEGGSLWAPRDLAELATAIAKNGPPSSPLDIGV